MQRRFISVRCFESSTHGYDTRDYRAVDRRLGDNGDFRQFVSLCHQSGIRVVVDGVFNHTGREFFAFRDIQEHKWDSGYKDWYRGIRFDCASPMGDPFSLMRHGRGIMFCRSLQP